MAKPNWERAAKDDYVKSHGSIPFWVGLGRGDADERALVRKELELRVRLATVLDAVAQFADLTPFERRRQYEMYFSRLCRRFDDERTKLPRSHSLQEAIDSYETGALALLKGVLSVREPDAEVAP